ncbi:MAG: ATP-binding protein [Pirellulales bacterium]
MTEPRWIWNTDEALPSQFGAGEGFLQTVLDKLAQQGWSERAIYAVRISLEEALANAIKHGNCLDCSKCVHVACKLSDKTVRIEISDEGIGFDPQEVPDPTHPENLESPCGRGILLMRNYMSRVEYNPCGNHVVMEKDRDDMKNCAGH